MKKKINSIQAYSILIVFFFQLGSFSQTKKNTKGLLPQVAPQKDKDINDDKEQEKALAGELLVNRAEDQAIIAIEKLIFKAKTNPHSGSDLASLKFRLAELYIRKAKSGRFFDLYQDLVKKQTSIDKQTIASTKPSLRKAIATLKDIEESHPKFDEMDVVFFNIANAYNALNESTSAEIYFENLIQRYPNSALRPDALLAYGEILYQKGKFESALKNFDEIKNFPESKAYPYSLYKSAWCSYNLKQNESAINKLVSSLELNNKMLTDIQKHSLRSESIKDLVLFSSETKKSDEIIDFFKKITNQSEFDEAMLALAKLYESHSRYKELIEFLEDYKEETTPRNQSWAQEFIINSLESLKKRKELISALKEFSEICKKDTSSDQVCLKTFQSTSREISQKWWEIWEKNKQHEEFSDLTLQVFEILLSQDDGSSDMAKNKISYADLLFQKANFKKSGEFYLQAAKNESLEPDIKEEAYYSSLIAYDKNLETLLKEEKNKDDKQIQQIYIEQLLIIEDNLKLKTLQQKSNQNKLKSIKYNDELLFKEIFNHYQLKNLDTVKNKIKINLPLVKSDDLKQKIQDIEFDILNQEKNYPALSKRLDELISTEKNKDRLSTLKKLNSQSKFAEIANGNLNLNDKIKRLESFIKTSETEELVEKSKQLLIAAYFENKEQKKATELVYEDAYIKKNQKNFTENQLQETTNYLMLLGQEDKVKKILSKQNPIAHCEYLTLLRRGLFASECYIQIYDQLKDLEKRRTAQLLVKEALQAEPLEKRVRNLLKVDDKNKDLLLEFEVQELEKIVDEKKWTESFNIAKKLLGKDIEQSLKARVRLVQAKVLAHEFMQQSVKAKVDRLALVLSLKTEKLDKAYQGFNAVLSYKPDLKTQLEALRNIELINSHYSESLAQYPRPEGLSDEEAEVLNQELTTLAKPIVDRNIEIKQQIQDLEKQSQSAFSANYLWMVQLPSFSFIEPPKNETEKASYDYMTQKLKNGHLPLIQFLITEALKSWPESSWTKELNFFILGASQRFDEINKNYDKNFFNTIKNSQGKAIIALVQYQNNEFKESFKTFSEIDKESLYNYRLEAEHLKAAMAANIDLKSIEKISQDYMSKMKLKKEYDREENLRTLLKEKYEKKS